MRVRLAAPRRTGLSSSLRIYPNKIRAALESASRGPVDLVSIEMGAESPRGGVIRPTFYQWIRSFPKDDSLWHAAEPNTAFRGVDVVTIHDFHPFTVPGFMMRAFRHVTRSAARRARRIVVESGVVRSDVGRYLGSEAEEKTRIIPPPYPTPPPGRGTEAYDVLWVGSAQRRKQPDRFLRELAEQRDLRLRVAFLCHPADAEYEEAMREAFNAARRVHDVERTSDDLSVEELDRLYRVSRVLVSTSTLEGYHVPVMEAWSRATRVVLPRIPLYTEIYGSVGGVHYYPPTEGFGSTLRDALSAGPFVPDRALLDWVSPPAVGRRLWAVYDELAGDEAAVPTDRPPG